MPKHRQHRSITLFLGAWILCAVGAGNAWSQCFDNAKLQQIAPWSRAQAGTLIYVWSPRMVLSLTQAHQAAQAAQHHGLDFLPLHDARLPSSELHMALQTAQHNHAAAAQSLQTSQALCADNLLQADALRHFPTAFVLSAAGVHRFAIVGAMPLAAWQHSIAQRLQP
jgi:hypothetical protein